MERLDGGTFYIHAFDKKTKKSYFICSTMRDHEALFNLLFDSKLSVYPSDKKEWAKYASKKYENGSLISIEVDDHTFDDFKDKLS